MINFLKASQKLMFREKLYLVHSIDRNTGTIILQSDGEHGLHTYGIPLVLLEANLVENNSAASPKTKAETSARIDELEKFHNRLGEFYSVFSVKVNPYPDQFRSFVNAYTALRVALEQRMEQLKEQEQEQEQEQEPAKEDIMSAVIRSHEAICAVKQMDEKEAYGQNPAFYYAAAVSAEAGECLNKMVKALRDGGNVDSKLKEAVISELPDVIVYGFVLAHVLNIDLTKIVTDKANIVIERARSGYYGGPLKRSEGSPCPTCKSFPRGPKCPIKCDEEH